MERRAYEAVGLYALAEADGRAARGTKHLPHGCRDAGHASSSSARFGETRATAGRRAAVDCADQSGLAPHQPARFQESVAFSPRFTLLRRLLPGLVVSLAAHWRVGLLVCVTTLVWVAQYDRWTPASWQLPTDYRGDALEILARIEAAAEGDTVPMRPQMISRLGAPFGANWSAYPSSDLMLLWTLGHVARVIGVFPAANLALLLAGVTAALSFYGCARWLRVRWEWAFAGALLFAFTFQTFHRGLAHLFIVFSWTVPPALLVCGLVAGSRRLRLRGGTGLFCIAIAAVIGAGNPYTLFLFVQLLGWAMIAQWFSARRRENLVTGAVALAVGVAVFLVVESHVWLFTLDTAATPPLVRNYGGTEHYALKPIEMLLPPPNHRWDALAFFGQRYLRWSDWRTGEAFAPYLGLVGLVGLGWLAAVSLRAVFRRRRLPAPALPTAWVIAFASVGGITNIVAFFTGVLVFRATNRFSVFISALALLFLVGRLSRWTQGRPRWLSAVAAAAVGLVGLSDQLPSPMDPARQERIAARVGSDQELGGRLEAELPARAMVFQLPVVGFPEVAPPFQLSDYEHFRPYLATRSIRFTYGALKGRSRGRWQRDTAELPVVEMIRELERCGFSAVYLHRRGFADRGEKLLCELAALGRTRRIESRLGEQVVVLLQPSPRSALPLARSLTFGRGWHEARPGGARWAFGPAALSYFNPQDRPLRAEIRLTMSAPAARHVRVGLNREQLTAVELGQSRLEVPLSVVLQPGVNRFDLVSSEPPVRIGRERDQLRTLAIHEHAVSVAQPETVPSGDRDVAPAWRRPAPTLQPDGAASD